jgi:hypothetical protein
MPMIACCECNYSSGPGKLVITPLDARFAATPQLGFASPGNRISKQSASAACTSTPTECT